MGREGEEDNTHRSRTHIERRNKERYKEKDEDEVEELKRIRF